MSDDSTSRILAALERLETQLAQTATREEIAKLRADLMVRMDKHADQLTEIRDDIAVVSGQATSARKNNETIRSDVQFLIEQSGTMERQIQRLEARVASLENGQRWEP